ncbi:TPA: hypothetical protein ACN35C_004692 [Vibrio parahaemolyticus]
MSKAKFYIQFGQLKTEEEYIEEVVLDNLSDCSEMWEEHPDLNLSDPEVMSDLKFYESDLLKKWDKFPIHFEIETNNQGQMIFDNLESIQFSPAGSNDMKSLSEGTNEEIESLFNGINSRIDYSKLPIGNVHLSYNEGDKDLFITASSLYVNNEYKFFITDANGDSADEGLGLYTLEQFKERIVELADYEDIKLSLDDVKISEVMIDLDDPDYELLQLNYADSGLPKNHYLKVGNCFKDSNLSEYYVNHVKIPSEHELEIPELNIKLSELIENKSVPYNKEYQQESDLLLGAVGFIKEKQESLKESKPEPEPQQRKRNKGCRM